jgi:hypothetical protein
MIPGISRKNCNVQGAGMSPKATWKSVERRVAAMFGAKRIALSGSNNTQAQTCSDTDHPFLFVEIKHRKKIPFYATWIQVKRMAAKEGKIPVVVIHQANTGEYIAMVSAEWLATLVTSDEPSP